MSLSPWDLSGNISFDFSLYRPRRPSYVFATRITRQRNESYRHATKDGPGGEPEEPTEADFIEGIERYKMGNHRGGRHDSYREAQNHRRRRRSEEMELKVVDYVPGVGGIAPGAAMTAASSSNHVSDISGNNLAPGIVIHVPNQVPYTSADDLNNKKVNNISGGGFGGDGNDKSFKAEKEKETISRKSSCAAELFASTSGLDPESRWKYRKNLLVLSISFILVFTAFRAIQNLQSSLNSADGLGVIAMGCVHGTTFLTCLFTPVLINKLTSKWTIVLGLLFYLFWIAANFYPHFYTLIPTSIGVGFGQSLAWGAQVTYIQKLAVDYAHLSREVTQQELYKFNGIFLACFQTSHIWGNMVSSLMLDSETLRQGYEETYIGNYGLEGGGYEDGFTGGTQCGVYDLCDEGYPYVSNMTALTPASEMVLKMMGSYLVIASTGFLLILFFLEKIGAKSDPEKPCLQLVWNNVRMLAKHKTYRLLIPLLLFNGFEQGFVYADYNKSYITCTIGVEYVGYNMITLGVANSFASLLVGVVARHAPREAIIGMGAILHIGVLVFLLVWIPDKNLMPVFYVISALWGICDAVWQTQCNCLVNISCPEEHDIAFQNFRMLQGLGAALAFFLGGFVCVAVKLYIIISLLVLATLFYVVVEYQLKQAEGMNSELDDP